MAIASRGELADWLEGKPVDWGQAIAARASLRVLPFALSPHTPKELVFSVIRANAVSWAALTCRAPDIFAYTDAAARDLSDAVSDFDFRYHDVPSNNPATFYEGDAIIAAANSVARAAERAHYDAADAAVEAAALVAALAGYMSARLPPGLSKAEWCAVHPGPYDQWAHFGAEVAERDAARAAAAAPARAAAASAAWVLVSQDCDRLQRDNDAGSASRRLAYEKLWSAGEPEGWAQALSTMAAGLRELDQSYQVWIDWYECRIRGEGTSFEIPGDTDRKEDQAILDRLGFATKEDFWGKGAAHVNATLKGWIDEARARVASRPPPPSFPSFFRKFGKR